MLTRLKTALTLVVISALVAAPAAHATFPGRPGKILFGEDLSNSACGPGHITTIDPDGGGRTELASGSQGSFSADGGQIAFASCKGNTFSQISVMNADGTDRREVISRAYSPRTRASRPTTAGWSSCAPNTRGKTRIC